ncbi:MAG: signal peptidase I [Clostridia bacterium]|nr:signal peptidase I [Clostridia bacterium]
MNYNSNTKFEIWIYTTRQSLGFFVACIFFIAIFGIIVGNVLNLQIFSVATSSMEPTIKTGEIVFVKPLEHYSVGDVLSFQSQEHGGIVITHRCIDVENVDGTTHYLCKGDNVSVALSVQDVVADDIVGKVIYSSVFLSGIVKFFQTNRVIILLTASILVIIYLSSNKEDYKNRIYI